MLALGSLRLTPRFYGVVRDVAVDVSHVLVACGSTNPGRTLERMMRVCRTVFPGARIDVALGRFARFESGDAGGDAPVVRAGGCVGGASGWPEASDVFIGATGVPAEKPVVGMFRGLGDFTFAQELSAYVFRNLEDLASLLREADLVVSAADATLYELCAVGVSTVVVPIVDN